MVRMQIQLTEEQAKTLKRIALSRHLSVAELIRKVIDTMIQRIAEKASKELMSLQETLESPIRCSAG